MTMAPHSWLSVRSGLRTAAGVLLAFVLAGYLIFNRPFARLGFEPIYIGELILVAAFLASLERLILTFGYLLRRSWTFRFIALFGAFGLLRLFWDVHEYGYWALRDGVLCGYALLAFVAPLTWFVEADVRRTEAPGVSREKEFAAFLRAAENLPTRIFYPLIFVGALGIVWGKAVRSCWTWDVRGTFWNFLDYAASAGVVKVDFLALAAAVAATVWSVAAVKTQPFRRHKSPLSFLIRVVLFLAMSGLAVLFFSMLWRLPTRALWPAPLVLIGVALVAFAYTKRRLAVLAAAAAVILSMGVQRYGGAVWERFQVVNREWELAENTDFSIAKREAECQALRLPPLVLSMGTTGDEEMKQERLAALFQTEEELETEQGKAAAHAVRWRAAFWSRCVHVTLAQNPLFGVGFGCNPANFFRDTPAWPEFEGNLRLNPPNRAPHSVHVSAFTRLGFVGLFLWLGILAGVAGGVTRTCWRLRRRLRDPDAALPVGERTALRARFWDGLALFCVWSVFLLAATFSVVLENPMGGFWFWSLTGVLAWWNLAATRDDMFAKKG